MDERKKARRSGKDTVGERKVRALHEARAGVLRWVLAAACCDC